jgi:Mn2+/Fe2+ NRAMP family transporter
METKEPSVADEAPLPRTGRAPKLREYAAAFGPGLVSGASANDPTTVASLAVVGATTVYGLSWLVILILPMLVLVQTIATSIAALATVTAVVSVGLLTLAADVKAGAEALTLVAGVPFYVFVLPLAVAAGWLLATNSYLKIERILASFTLIFLCYAASAVYAHPDWGEVLRGILIPHFELTPAFATGAIALLGTTLTSYTYFWQSIGVAERRPAPSGLHAAKVDAAAGMLLAGASFIFILVATAATSGKHHLPVQTATDAARALRPLAGSWDQFLFGVGLMASAAIALPVIAATNGYVVAQAFGLRASLALKPAQAPAFYWVIFASLAAGAALAMLPIPTIAFLFWVSVVAGIVTPATLALMLLVARDPRAMRGRPIGRWTAFWGWVTTGIVTLAAIAFLVANRRG